MKLLENKKVLITGGAGFIGSNLCEKLITQQNEVICLDNFSTGFKKNIQALKDQSNFTLVEGDIRNLDTCKKAVEGCDIVFHQAALGSVPRSINDPMTSVAVNIDGFVNMLYAAAEAHVGRFIYAASSSTYGDHETLPKTEHIIGKPLSPYAITKFVNELIAENFSTLYKIDTIGLRYFNVFGRRQNPNGAYAAVIPKFILTMMEGQSPVINGDGSFSRDFTYIDNVIQANEKAATIEKDTLRKNRKEYYNDLNLIYDESPYISEILNVAQGQRTDLNELVEGIKTALAAYNESIISVKAKYGPKRNGDIPHSHASINKAKKLIDYTPQYLFQNGLKEAVNWYWENMNSKHNV